MNEGTPSSDSAVEGMEPARSSAAQRAIGRRERVRQALEAAGVPYALAGCQAAAWWVAQVDAAAPRLSSDVDVLLRRDDFALACIALEQAGFDLLPEETLPRHIIAQEAFLDQGERHPLPRVFIHIAGEWPRGKSALLATPDLAHPQAKEADAAHRILGLDSLVRMSLSTYSPTDQMVLEDLVEVGLLSANLRERVPACLRARLSEILQTPNRS